MAENAPIIMTAAMGPADQAWADRLREKHFPPERNFLSAHITLFHHLPGSCLSEVEGRVSTFCRDYAPPNARLDRLVSLGRGVAYHIESPELLSIREQLADAFHGLLTPQDQARPRLHITVQNKVDPKEAKQLLAELEADFVPRPIAIVGIALHYYRGGPWEAIAMRRFRGAARAAR